MILEDLHGSVLKCLTSDPEVLGSINTGPLRFFSSEGHWASKTLQSPSLALVKTRKDMNNMSCCRDMTEILLKAV